MRCLSRRPTIVVASLLFTAAGLSHARGEDVGDTLKFRPTVPPQSAVDAAPAPPQQAVPSPTQPQPAQQPTTAAPARAFPRLGSGAMSHQYSLAQPQVTSQTRQALDFYGGNAARATLSQLPRRAPLQHSPPQQIRRPAKPFETVHHEPTVSPYMNLFREEEELESAPNYFAFVRPQMEQLDANRMQQREIQQLRGQLNSVSSTVAGPRYEPPGVPATGTAARYMDTAQFYGAWRR